MSDRALRVLAGLVTLVGIAVAGYLTWTHYGGSAVACPIGGGCETVQSSEYAKLAGVPVAVLGLGTYAVVFVFLVWDTAIVRLGAAAVALTGLLFSLYLLVVQLFVIDAICIWCLVNDAVVAPALAILTALRLRS